MSLRSGLVHRRCRSEDSVGAKGFWVIQHHCDRDEAKSSESSDESDNGKNKYLRFSLMEEIYLLGLKETEVSLLNEIGVSAGL